MLKHAETVGFFSYNCGLLVIRIHVSYFHIFLILFDTVGFRAKCGMAFQV